MHTNIFEGCRRLGYALQVLLIIAGLGLIALDKPYMHAQFITTGPDAPFTLTDNEDYCADFSGAERLSAVDLGKGRETNITLCFRAQETSAGCMMVPYKSEARKTVASGIAQSPSVEAYTKLRADNFKLTPEDRATLLKRWNDKRTVNTQNGLIVLFVLWLCLFTAIKMIGWIVRGFLGLKPDADRPAGS